MKKQQATTHANPTTVDHKWIIIDAAGQVLGRVAEKAASIIRGKHKPEYTPAVDTGDFVVIINADKVRVTGKKAVQKMYYRHSGFPGGLKEQNFSELMRKHPTRILEQAVKGMLPHNRLGRRLFTKLKVYTGDTHPHEAQQPEQVMV
ncbi:50S ribosomal protein L13 [bacterium]|nr:50S ribosomal protein L13 [bacterium]